MYFGGPLELQDIHVSTAFFLAAQPFSSMAAKQDKGIILTPDVAVTIQAAALIDGQPFLLCHELQKTVHGHDSLSHWKQTRNSVSCVPLPQIARS